MEIIFFIIAMLALLAVSGYVAYITYKNIPRNVISFKESTDLTSLPIATFTCGKKKLNFILDSGATACVIDENVVTTLSNEYCTKTNLKEEVWGMEGNAVNSDIMQLDITYSNLTFNELFLVSDLSQAFNKIKEESGVKLHGIIGNNFFIKHKYILDFEKMLFYNKR